MKNYIGLIIIIVLLTLIYLEFNPEKNIREASITETAVTVESEPTDYQAAFMIYTYGTQRNFSNSMYHNRSPNVYIQDENPNIINVKKTGVTWGDFFKTLPMKVADDCLTTGTGEKYCNGQGGELKFYINGTRVSTILSREIKRADTLLISYGFETPDEIKLQMELIPLIP